MGIITPLSQAQSMRNTIFRRLATPKRLMK